jgi:hypothetical protein
VAESGHRSPDPVRALSAATDRCGDRLLRRIPPREKRDLKVKEEYRMRYFHLIIGAEAEEPVEWRLAEAVDESGRGGDRWAPARRRPVGWGRENTVLSTDGPFAETKE